MADVDNDTDDLSAAISAAMDATPVTDTAPPAIDGAAAQPTTAAEDARARDDQGRFKAKEEAAAAAKADPKTAVADPTALPPITEQPKQSQAPAVIPPSNWNGAGKIDFARLPAPIQKQISDDYSRLSQTQAQLDSLNAAIGPQRAQALAATYGSVEGALKSLLAMSDMASQDAGGFVRWFAQQRGIDLSQLIGQGRQPGEEPVQPHSLEQKVSQLETIINNFTQQHQQGAQAQVNSIIDSFSADPAHPYFKDVEPQIIALLRDVVKTGTPQERLKSAYDMATWANPETRASLITQERERLAAEDVQRVQQARDASVSISGSPQGSKIAADESDDDLEGTIRKQVARAFS